MVSFFALQSYNPFLNLLIGIIYFIGVAQLGNLLLKLFLGNFPNPFHSVVAVLLGFLSMSALMTLLSICFWINSWTIYTTNLSILCLFLFTVYQKTPIVYSSLKDYTLIIPKSYYKITLLSILILILSILPILYYVLLPSTKIDEIHYHLPPAQYIVLEGGYTYPHYYLRVPSLMIYYMSQIPLVYLGFPDAFNVISMLFWFVILYFSNAILKDFSLILRLLIASILLVGLYAVVQTTSSSAIFSFLSVFSLVALYVFKENIVKKSSLYQFCWVWAITGSATAVAKISLLVVVFFFSLFLIADIVYTKKLTWKIIVAISLPFCIFYLPTLFWTYANVGAFWGHFLADFFPFHKYNKEELAIANNVSTILNGQVFKFWKNNLINYSLIKPLAFILFFMTTIDRKLKYQFAIILICIGLCIGKIGNIIELRYWGAIDNILFIITLFYARNSWKLQLQKPKIQLAIIIVCILPYLSIMYYYVANLNPIPFFSKTNKEIFCEKFIPYYNDYQALDKILPKNAVLFFPEGNVNISYAPRKLYIDARDIHQDTVLYIITSSLAQQPQYHTIQAQQYEKGEKVYENQNSYIRTYRTPNQARKTAILEVHKLQKAKL